MLTILIFIDWFHPAYKAGGPIQSIANMVSQFKDNVSYKIFCSNTDLDGTVLNVPADSWVDYNETTQVYYVSKKNESITLLKKEIKNIDPDILFINGIYSWFYNLIPLIYFKGPRKIVSVRGMLHPGALSQKKTKKKIFLFLWKILGLHRKCDFHASTEEEKNYIENIFGTHVKTYVAPNFPKVLEPGSRPGKNQDHLILISIALVSPMKNHLLVLKALQLCTSQIEYHIYGAVKDNAYWNECLKEINSMPENISVIYHGGIQPLQVEDALKDAHVFILPSKSENFGHAFYEALSAGKPVITSYYTPWNNLKDAKAGANTSIDNIMALKEAIQYFAGMDNAEYIQWSAGAKEYSTNAINIGNLKNEYRQMFFV